MAHYRSIGPVFISAISFLALLPFFLLDTTTEPTKRLAPRHARNRHGNATTPQFHSKPTLQNSSTLTDTQQPNISNDDNIFIVFSTSCTDQQHWESYILFYHAWRVRQPGMITRIASGCSDEAAQKLQAFHEQHIATALSPRFRLHLTPDFSRVHLEKGKHPYKYNNKPYGLLHWMEHGPAKDAILRNSSQNESNSLLVLMDPDMILLRPITSAADLAVDDTLLWLEADGGASNTPDRKRRVVGNGILVAQQDGYLSNNWRSLVPKLLPGNRTPPQHQDCPLFWNSGPPYFGTLTDWYPLARRWTELAGPVLDEMPHLFSEMFSLILAAVDRSQPFTMAASFAISSTTSTNREGWEWIDRLEEDPCRAGQAAVQGLPKPTPTLPYMLHYCKRYGIGRYFFSKYRVKKNILTCGSPLMALPDANATNSLHMIFPPRADGKDRDTYVETPHTFSEKQAKRETFMVCGMMQALNEALLHFKKQSCGASANTNATYMIVDDPGST